MRWSPGWELAFFRSVVTSSSPTAWYAAIRGLPRIDSRGLSNSFFIHRGGSFVSVYARVLGLAGCRDQAAVASPNPERPSKTGAG